MDERSRLSGLEVDGFGDGDIGIFVVSNGRAVFTRLAIPADWASVPYVLGISGGFPAWLPVADGTVLGGYGNSFGNSFGG